MINSRHCLLLASSLAFSACLQAEQPAPAIAPSDAIETQIPIAPEPESAVPLSADQAAPVVPEAATSSEITALPLEELRKFANVFGTIKNEYVEPIDDTTLLNYAIQGMLSGLDPHSAYLDPKQFSELQESTSGAFGGLGIEVGMENGFVKVIAPIDDTPAQKGGIQAGDLIIRLDETPVKGLSLSEAVDMMRGEPGTKIMLTVVREGEREPMEIELERAVIKVNSIKTLPLDDKYGYIRITQFQKQTGEDFAKGIEKLKSQISNFSGLIIDLRNNPGGVLQASVQVADHLIEDGLIVYTQGRSEVSRLSMNATPGDLIAGKPVVVLIDGGSASASEILAGALQDHKRAVIMGTQSFGKGSVQNVLPLGEDYGLKLTTSRYYTPKGRSIQAEGIVPDIEVARAKLSEEKEAELIREADLAGHLSNGSDKDSKAKDKNASNKTDAASEDGNSEQDEETKRLANLESDFQLQEARNLLKAIDILNIKLKD